MMTIKQFWLTKLAEECTEVGQRALKQIQFGADQIWKGGEVPGGIAPNDNADINNAQRLLNELSDLSAIVSKLQTMGEIPSQSLADFKAARIKKLAKIEKYLMLSQDLGLVERA